MEIKGDNGEILLEAGKVVNSTFKYVTSDNITSFIRIPISNYDHERALNDEKSNIWVLRDQYVEDFVDEFETLLEYLPNEELGDGEDIKMTQMPLRRSLSLRKLHMRLRSVSLLASDLLVSRNWVMNNYDTSAGFWRYRAYFFLFWSDSAV